MNDNATEIARLKSIIAKLMQAGASCSNVCFNLSQVRGHVLTHTECTSMREAARVWDEVTKHARKAAQDPVPDPPDMSWTDLDGKHRPNRCACRKCNT